MIFAPISIAFFSNSVVQDFKENSDYEKVKAKLELLEVGPSNTQPSKPFQTKNKGLVAETYDWDEEKVTSNDEEMVKVKVLMALSKDDKMAVGKSHARNDEWVNITMRKAINESLALTEASSDPESSKESVSEPQTPLPHLKIHQISHSILEVTPMIYQQHYMRERFGLDTTKHTKLESQASSSKNVSGTVTIECTEPATSLVPTKV
ncbi:hypothetical protein Tco_1215548 [Tanacetum coccineum]